MSSKTLTHFKKIDPIIYNALLKVKLSKIEPRKPDEYFSSLCSAIIGQQLSGKVADVIESRFLKLFPDEIPTPKFIVLLEDEKIRSIGTSYAKIRSLKDLSCKVINLEIHLDKLQVLKDEDVVSELVKVKGIGPWTAEMFLMFTLGREDIFSYGDLGLKNGIKKLYNLQNPSREDIENIVSKWSPYKSYGSRVLWKILEV